MLNAPIRKALTRQYQEGMQDGVLMTLDLILGEDSGLLPNEQYERLRYRGPLGDGLREWLEERRNKALAEKRNSRAV